MSTALTLSFSADAAFAEVRAALRCVPPPILQGMLAAAVLCALAPIAIDAIQPAAVDAAVKAVPASSLDAAGPVARTRCHGCGFVVSIRRVEAAGLLPAAYEFTVRMRDGSLRTSSASSAGKWSVGDRIILVGDAKVTVH